MQVEFALVEKGKRSIDAPPFGTGKPPEMYPSVVDECPPEAYLREDKLPMHVALVSVEKGNLCR
jgi:hypothetical protein